MEAYQERVVAEKKDLDEKRDKLIAFLKMDDHGGVSPAEIGRLTIQSLIMDDYSEILAERIASFKLFAPTPTEDEKCTA